MSTSEQTVSVLYCVFPYFISFYIKWKPGTFNFANEPFPVSHVFPNRTPRCGSLGLLVLVNVILALPQRVFVSPHAALSAHPSRQPTSLLPGINRPCSAEPQDTSLLPLRGTTPCLSPRLNPSCCGAWSPALPPSKGLNVILRPAGHPHCVPFDIAGLP